MTLMGITGFIALTLMIAAYTFKRPGVSVASGILWLLFGIWSLTLSTSNWDIYYDLFIVGIGMFIMGLVEAMTLRPAVKDENAIEDYWDRARKEYNRYQEEQAKLSQIKNKKRAKRTDNYDLGDEI